MDPGTYDYFSFPAWRAYFRSTRAHNTVVVDGLDQSQMLGPFLWGAGGPARSASRGSRRVDGGRVVGEHDGYTGWRIRSLHRRTLSLDAESRVLTICDEIVAQGTHDIASYFHLAEDAVVSAEPAEPVPDRCRPAGR